MEIRIEPLDTLFFRDGKPFTIGEETWADSNLLPSPSVIYGALRTAIATQEGIEFEDIEDKLKEDKVSVKNIYYYTDGNRLPMPLDFVELKHNTDKNEKNKVWIVNALELLPKKSIIHKAKQHGFTHFLKHKDQAETIDDGLISTADFEDYLIGYLDEVKVKRVSKNYIDNEPKIGIGRDDSTKTSDAGSLFRTDMKRFKKKNLKEPALKIGVCLKTDLGINTLVRLGGEGKIIDLSHLPKDTLPFKINTQDIDFDESIFRVYLSTPAIFWDGYPTFPSKWGINATLIAACVGKPLSIGGYDMKNNKPKPMYQVVPAGSVFYFDCKDDLSLLQKVLNDNQGMALSDVYPEQGFGIAYFGAYHKAE
ncbi:MAG: type III-B CRISPR module-associated protein Cmr3 [Saprospiraceae bacterium]|nr:type III-B CRISPR module-associated protein Cmr3 [Saprospiraceae bacterium]